MSNMKILAKLIISGKIKLLTGLHIGGTEGNFEIGGMDNPIVRDPITKLPYIPGSSLKGKLRSELEWMLGKITIDSHDSRKLGVPSKAKEITLLFGDSADNNKTERIVGNLIFRDAFLDGYENFDISKSFDEQIEQLSPTIKALYDLDTGLPFTEWKMENTLNRLTAHANPRSIERVPAGALFNYEIIYSFYSDDDKKLENFKNFLLGIKSLEDSYLGGNGTRGYGKIKFVDTKYILKTIDDYKSNSNGTEIEFDKLEETIKGLQA